MDLADHFRAMWQRRWGIIAGSLAVALLVGAWRSSSDEVYEARSLVGVVAADPAVVARPENLVFLARSYGVRASTRPVLADAVERSGLPISVDEADDRSSAQVSSSDATVTIVATGPTPREAATLTDALTDALIANVAEQQELARAALLAPIDEEIAALGQALRSLPPGSPEFVAAEREYQALATARAELRLEPTDRLDLLSPAVAPTEPVSPRPVREALLAFLVAAVVAAELAVGLELLERRRSGGRDPEAALAELGVPLLRALPSSPGPELVDVFRHLRTDLGLASPSGAMRSLLVAPVEPAGADGVAVGLARAVADAGRRVVLVDADMRNPALHDVFGAGLAPGLSDSLVPATRANGGRNASRQREPLLPPVIDAGHNVLLLPAGGPVGDPPALLAGGRFRTVLEDLVGRGLVVVSAPALRHPDAVAAAGQVDAVLIVVSEISTARDVRMAVTSLTRAGAALRGAVVTAGEPGRVRWRPARGLRQRHAPTTTA